MEYYVGLDLGQAQDFTALAVLYKTPLPDPDQPGREVNHYAVRHLERLRLGTPYPDVCARAAGLFARPPLARSTLAVDHTGVGRPVYDMLRRAKVQARLRAVTITAGHRASSDPLGGYRVPKRELVSLMQVLLQARRLKVARSLPAATALVKELQEFQVKVTPAANEEFGNWREGRHDDLVLAVALAAWVGERLKAPAVY